MLAWPLQFLRRALEAMVRGPRVALVATLTIAVAVFVTGLFATALRGGHRLLEAWAGEIQISVYLDPAADLEVARAAAASAAPGRTVEAVTAEEALRRFRRALGPQGGLVDGLGASVLPPSIEVRASGIGLAETRALAAKMESVPGAREVDFGNDLLERLERLLRRLRMAGVALLATVALGTSVLVANTLQLGVFARRDEIEIMKLVGATDAFVGAPFLIEGVVEGIVGGALAAGALVAGAGAILPRLSEALGLGTPILRAEILPASFLAALVAGGAALGIVASAVAVRRELRRR